METLIMEAPAKTENIEIVRKKISRLFDFRVTTQTLYPRYGKGTGKENTVKDWYFVFLSPTDCIWYIEAKSIQFMKERPDFVRRLYSGGIKEITATEFDSKITKFFKGFQKHIEGADEIWARNNYLSTDIYIANHTTNMELNIIHEQISFDESKYSRIDRKNEGTGYYQFQPVTSEENINKCYNYLSEKLNWFKKFCSPSQLGYRNFLKDEKQIPKSK